MPFFPTYQHIHDSILDSCHPRHSAIWPFGHLANLPFCRSAVLPFCRSAVKRSENGGNGFHFPSLKGVSVVVGGSVCNRSAILPFRQNQSFIQFRRSAIPPFRRSAVPPCLLFLRTNRLPTYRPKAFPAKIRTLERVNTT